MITCCLSTAIRGDVLSGGDSHDALERRGEIVFVGKAALQ